MRRSTKRPILRWTVVAVLLAGLVVAVGLSTKVVGIEEADAADQAGRFDAVEYAADVFDSEISPQIQADALPLADLLSELARGTPENELGQSPGDSSSFTFAVSFEGIAGAPNGSLLPVTVEGVSGDVVVQVQIGPAINGTAIRDVTGTISFNDFKNQLEFQDVATELNNLVRDTVLTDVDPASLEGKTIRVVGAYTRVNPALISVVPVVFEVG